MGPAMLDVTRLRDLAISDAGFVFDPLTGHTYNVNATALALLRALKDDRPRDAIAAELREAFELDPEHDVARDVDEFISRLREHGLIR